MVKGVSRRCHFFDRQGNPIDGGCPRSASACAFYHPEEEGWHTAKIPYTRGAPTSKRGQHSGSHNTRRSSSPPYGYRRDSGYSKDRRSIPRSSSPAHRTRRDSITSSAPDPAESPRISMAGSSSQVVRSDHLRRVSLTLTDSSSNVPNKGLQQQQPQSSTSSIAPRPSSPKTLQQQQQQASSSSSLINPASLLPTPPVTALQARGFRDASFPPSSSRASVTTSAAPMNISVVPRAMRSPQLSINSRSTPRTGPPAPPKDPFPMPPPRPLPAIPPALSVALTPPTTVEPTAEEKRTMWEERTRILSEAELAHEELVTLKDQYAYALQIVDSRYFADLPEEDKVRLKGQLAELEKQRDEAKKLYEDSVEKLFKTGSWPVAPPSSTEPSVEEKHREVVKYIQELKDTALQMNKILADISTFKPPPPQPPLFLSGDSDNEDGAAMDVDQPDGNNAHPKSLKRRRISENLDGRGGGSALSMPTQKELDEFLERLAHMEGLISTLENDINAHGREAREEFEHLVDTKLDEFQATREAEEKQRLEEEQQQIQYMEQEITLAGEQVGELATEIGDLIMRVGKLEVDVGTSKKGRQESFEKVLEVERRLQEYISKRDANVHVIQTFEKALNAYTSRPPSPPATPLNMIPSFDYIIESLEEPMKESLRSFLVPAIEDLRKDVEDMVRTQNEELYSTLWNKMTVTLKVLEMIQSKINQGDIEPGESLAETTEKR